MIKSEINFLEILWISIAFIIATIIGTLSHEYGHIAVAKHLGYQTSLHYGSMNFYNNDKKQFDEIYIKNKFSIENNTDFSEKLQFEKLEKKLTSDNLLITIGGPFQTILTGTIGLILLLFRRKKIQQNGMKIVDWLYVFLSLFWLREVFNLVTSVAGAILFRKKNYFGDEKVIENILEIPSGSVAIPLAIIGLLISIFVIFKIIPIEKRLIFLIGGMFGGILGFILWLRILGPIILP